MELPLLLFTASVLLGYSAALPHDGAARVKRVSNVHFALPTFHREKRQTQNPTPTQERALVDAEVQSRAHLTGFGLVSKGTVFSASSYKDWDKQANQAFLTGNSWMAQQHDEVGLDHDPRLWADLGGVYDVCGFVLGGRYSFEKDYATQLKVEIGMNNATFYGALDRFDHTEVFVGIDSGVHYATRLFETPITGRYVKLSEMKAIAGAAVAIRIGFLYECQYSDMCIPNPCQNGGVCTSSTTDYSCECPVGYLGKNCNERVSCSPNPCENGGLCTVGGSSGAAYICECAVGYKGVNCERPNYLKTTPTDACARLDSGEQNFRNCFCSCTDGWMFSLNDSNTLDYFAFQCGDQLRYIDGYHQRPLYQPIRVKCPSGGQCADAFFTSAQYPVWGDWIRFTDDSALCKAALHAYGPDYLDQDKILEVFPLETHREFPSNENNGVKTQTYTQPWKAFTFFKSEAWQEKKRKK